jgi:hypothetical protein
MGVTVDIEDTPCGLGDISDKLAENGVHVKSCCVVGRQNGRAQWSLEVDDEGRAREVLGLPAGLDA